MNGRFYRRTEIDLDTLVEHDDGSFSFTLLVVDRKPKGTALKKFKFEKVRFEDE